MSNMKRERRDVKRQNYFVSLFAQHKGRGELKV